MENQRYKVKVRNSDKEWKSIILLGWIIRMTAAFSSQNGRQDTVGLHL